MRNTKAVLLALSLLAATECCAEEPVPGTAPALPKLGGYVEGWYYSDSSDLSALASAKNVENAFRVRRARLAASGEIGEALGYKVGAALDGPAPGAAASTVKLLDAWMEYRASDALKAAFGQIKYDFTLEGSEATPDRLPVLRSEVSNELAGKLGTLGGTFRDIGLRLSGEIKEACVRYSVAVINGSGINTGDNNGSKDLVGRVTVEPARGFVLGASGYMGRAQEQGASFNVDETAWGMDASYATGGLRLRAEYAEGRWENWDAAASAAAFSKTQEPWGWYAQASYALPFLKKVEVMGRYEYFEKDRNTADSGLEVATVGATYYLKGKTRLTANYLFRTPEESAIVTAQETSATGHSIGDLLIFQALVSF